MKKCLLLAALILVSQLNNLKAQTLISAPDTVCINQPISLSTSDSNASSYFWGFCSGYLLNTPDGQNLGKSFAFTDPSAIDIAYDGTNYYAFVTNRNTNSLLRLSFGNSLSNTPTVYDYGNLGGYLSDSPSAIHITKDTLANNWFIFIAGGTNAGNSSLCRLDFGSSLNNNKPNIVNFGNLNKALDAPRGLFIASEGGNWYGFCVNNDNSTFVRMDFGNNISLTPVLTNQGNIGGLNYPSDMAAIEDISGNWYFYVTNSTSSLDIITMGSSLADTNDSGANVGNPSGNLNGPSAISIIKDCGSYYAFITNQTTNELVRVDLPNFTGPYSSTDYGVIGKMNSPTGITRAIRSDDNVYGFVINDGDSSLTKFEYSECSASTVASSQLQLPPVYKYDTPGVYNVYFIANEGLPNMQMDCHTIVALPIPAMKISNDTAICQRDTITISVFSQFASSYSWAPVYNLTIKDTNGNAVLVAPQYSLRYSVILKYPDGCIVDTSIGVHVSKVIADAGPDRTISDGAETLLGGPLTSQGPNYHYTWYPSQFLNNTTDAEPIATPRIDFTYYLQVTETNDSLGCQNTDTVLVHVDCEELNLPNAFAPSSSQSGANTFGILNKQIVKLDFLRVFDRWGNKVFETTDPTQKWDGYYNGTAEPVGVYTWEAEGYCLSGHKFFKSGNVTLIR